MNKVVANKIGAWLRGLVWTSMIAGCAWAGAQSYLVTPPAGHYHTVAMGVGEGVGLGAGVGAEGGGQATQPLAKDDLFAGTEIFAKNAADITEITMDPDTLNLVGGNDRGRARSMVLNVVRTYTYDKPGMYNMSDVEAIRNKLNTGDWHCSVHIRDLKNGTGSDVCGKRRTDGMKETAIIQVEQKQLTFIHTIRKEGPGGSSELGYFPMLPGLHGLPAIAMMDPEAFAEMQIGLHGMPFVWSTSGAHVYTFNSDGIQEKMDKLNKELKDMKVRPFEGERHILIAPPPPDAAAPEPKAAPKAPKAAPVPEPKQD